ncbi:monoxygenase, putative [Ricinus communis]|uniref:Monoxygenase, putative n=1 Tax=Ricinus communis TaxID=3988 RepID=B9SVQ7_RICCO|nr:monoxygenase, putative [Ricinus communis]
MVSPTVTRNSRTSDCSGIEESRDSSFGFREIRSAANHWWLALDALGVSHKLTSLYSPTLGGSVTNVASGAVQEILLAGNNGPRPVHRKILLEALAQELPVDSIRFSSKITSIEMQENKGASGSFLCLEDGNHINTKVLIGCDGLHSVVAKWLGLSEPIHSGRSAVRGLAIYPQGHGFKQEVHQFVDVGIRAGFVPLNDKELYWFLCCFGDYYVEKYIKSVNAFGVSNHQYKLLRQADPSGLTWAPLMLRNPFNVMFRNISKRNVTVAGDAMHPMTPDLAQGGCLALEDAVVLGRHVGNSFIKNGRLVPEETTQAIDGYVKERRWRAAWVITRAFLSGWVQQEGSNWLMKFLRDAIFYRFLFPKLSRAIFYDCGTLPTASADQLNSYKKTD